MNDTEDSREITPVDIVASLRAIAAEEDRHDLLLLAAADEIERLRRQVRDYDQALSNAEHQLTLR